MNKNCLKIIFLSLIVLTGAITLCFAQDDERDAVYQVIADYFKAINAGNQEEILKLYTEDAVVMVPFAPSRIGKSTIEAESKGTYKIIDFDINFIVDEIIISGDWAFARSRTDGRVIVKTTGDTMVDKGKSIHILHKQSDGSWKIARYMFNTSKPVSQY